MWPEHARELQARDGTTPCSVKPAAVEFRIGNDGLPRIFVERDVLRRQPRRAAMANGMADALRKIDVHCSAWKPPRLPPMAAAQRWMPSASPATPASAPSRRTVTIGNPGPRISALRGFCVFGPVRAAAAAEIVQRHDVEADLAVERPGAARCSCPTSRVLFFLARCRTHRRRDDRRTARGTRDRIGGARRSAPRVSLHHQLVLAAACARSPAPARVDGRLCAARPHPRNRRLRSSAENRRAAAPAGSAPAGSEITISGDRSSPDSRRAPRGAPGAAGLVDAPARMLPAGFAHARSNPRQDRMHEQRQRVEV